MVGAPHAWPGRHAVGRTKEYHRDDVLEKAMQLFWLHGYDGVSTQILIEAMGINRKSVYVEFGNKRKLYHAALDRYLCEVVPQRFFALNRDDAGLQTVFDTLGRFAGASGRPGAVCAMRPQCLIQNSTHGLAILP